MAKERILIVEDDDDIRALVAFNLKKAGLDTIEAADGETGLELARSERPDLVILDLMLPGIDGHQVTYRMKMDPQLKDIPIVMLTAKSEETDVVIGLGIGADDYITKPFSPRVLLARVQAVLRRGSGTAEAVEEQSPVDLGWLQIDPSRHETRMGDETLKLTPIEFKILLFLAMHPGFVFTRSRIIDEAQGEDVTITERTVDVHVVSLRKKLGDRATHRETVRGIGYKFTE
jgi:two-component system phosphate regulon response regulator PhoB